jgi:hypothetical protein
MLEVIMQRRGGSILGALILIALGVWFLAKNLNLSLPRVDALWPAFVMLGGLLRDPGQVFVGVAGLLCGAFFFLFTLGLGLPLPGLQEGIGWDDMARLWPAFPLIGGLAFLAQFAVDPKHDWGEFVVGVLAIVVGAVAFPFTLGLWPGDLGMALFKLWPLLLVVAGLATLLQVIFRRRK